MRSRRIARLGGFFDEGLPIALGIRRPVETTWNFGGFGQAAYLLMLAVLVSALMAVLIRTRHRWVPLALALYPVLFALFPTSFYVKDGRYLSFRPLASLLLGLAVGSFRRDWVLGIGFERSVVGDYALIRPDDRVMPEELVWQWAEQRDVAPAGAATEHLC